MAQINKEAEERPEMARTVGDVLRDIERAAANGEELADLIYDLARITKSVCAALDAAEAEKRAAVAAAHEEAERRARYYERIIPRSDRAAYGLGRAEAADAIRALSDTDALAEYVERVRAEAFKEGVEAGFAAAIRQETNDE
jgi:hypothetical protein